MNDFIAEIGRMPKSPLQVFQAYWQPIETAPKDGSAILVYVAGKFYNDAWCDVAYFNDIENAWYSGGALILKPTHWMSLPAPPVSE